MFTRASLRFEKLIEDPTHGCQVCEDESVYGAVRSHTRKRADEHGDLSAPPGATRTIPTPHSARRKAGTPSSS